jgi:RND family efflux transporter MFP subunit
LELRVKQAEAQLAQARAKLGLKQEQKEDELDRTKVPTVVQEKALWDQALDNLRRAQTLREGRAIAVEELQQRQADVAVAAAKYLAALNDVDEQVALVGVRRQELALARQTLEDSKVPAPFDGIVEYRHVAPGAYVRVGDPIVFLVRVNPLRFQGGVPEREAAYVREGQETTITVEGRREPITARICRISPALELSSRALVIEVDVPNPALPPANPPSSGEATGAQREFPLRAGVFAEAEIVVDPEARALVVPAAAVREFAGVEKVWLVRSGQAEEQIVQTGRRDHDRVEILRGLSRGDLVVAQSQTGRRGPVVAEEPATVGAGQPKR